MTALTAVMLCSLVICAFTLLMTVANLLRYRRAPGDVPVDRSLPLISVCIPARNEASNLPVILETLLDGGYPRIEVLVYDDQSTDGTAAIIEGAAAQDSRVRRVPTRTLPPGWNGKQHACHAMAEAAAGEWLLFTDADVRFSSDCLTRTLAAAERSGVDLLSTFPRQETGSKAEALIVPLIHWVLLSYLPMGRMRHSFSPGASAGCGQFLFARADAYRASGGHAEFKDSMHDGIKLPRAFRRARLRTDIFDGTDLASCRMYRDARSTWMGFAKNAYEGLGSVWLLAFITVLHTVGHVAPWVMLLAWPLFGRSADGATVALALGAVGCAVVQRSLLAWRFGQPRWPILLHPLAVALLTSLQWHSFVLHLTGRRSWRGRGQPARHPTPDVAGS